MGQIEAAQQTLEKMLQFARNKPDQPQHKPDAVAFSQAELFGSLSEQQFQQGNTRAVAESLTKAGQFARSITDPAQRLKALSSTAVYAKLAGNSRLAKALFVEVLRAAEAFPTGLEQVEIRVGIAQDMAEAGDPAGAGAILNQVNQQIQQLSDPVERVGALAILARGWAEIKNIPLAEQVLAKAQTQLQALTDTTARPPALQFWQRPQAEAHGAMARNLLWQGQRDAGLKLFQQAQKEARAIADPLEQALALGTIARQLAQAGEPSQSRQVFAMALDIATGQEHSAKP